MYTVLEDRKEQSCDEYIADCVGALVRRFFRYTGAEDFDFPLYTDRFREKQPELTADQIIGSLLQRLEGEN